MRFWAYWRSPTVAPKVKSVMELATEKVKKSGRAQVALRTFTEMLEKGKLDGERRKWAEARWLYEAIWMFTTSIKSQYWHRTTTFVGVFSSLATPVAAGIATTNTNWGAWARPITLVIGLIGATSVAIDQIMRNGERWRLYRSGYEDLVAEGSAFFNDAGKYAGIEIDKRFEKFFEQVEKILASRGQRYMVEVASDSSGGQQTDCDGPL